MCDLKKKKKKKIHIYEKVMVGGHNKRLPKYADLNLIFFFSFPWILSIRTKTHLMYCLFDKSIHLYWWGFSSSSFHIGDIKSQKISIIRCHPLVSLATSSCAS